MKLIPLLLLATSCGTASHQQVSTDTIKVKMKESFEIKLGTNMGTGYSWSLKDSAYRQFLSLDTVYTISNAEGKDNAPETQVFRFTALKKSNTTLHFLHARPWRKEEKPDQEKQYQVIIE
jgi:predicted secreted protein